MGENAVRFNPLWRKAEARALTGGAPPETFVSKLLMRNTSLSRTDRVLAWASAQGSSAVDAAGRRMRRVFGPMGNVGRQDVLLVKGLDFA